MIRKYEKAMIFGVFDRLHKGHHFFINSAQKYCKNLIIVVTLDNMVKIHKNRLPKSPINKRMGILKKEFPKLLVCSGDKKPYSWKIIKKIKPDLIIVGYDQVELKTALKKIQKEYGFKLVIIKNNYKGDKLHSSLLSKK
jgi:FAD synthetase